MIHTDTYAYIHIHAHTYDTYTYIHCKISVHRGFWRGAAAASDPVGRHHLPRSPWKGLRTGPTCFICPQDAYSLRQRCALTPYTVKSASTRAFDAGQHQRPTPWGGTTYPDLLGRGIGRDLRASFAHRMRIHSDRDVLWPPQTRVLRAGAPKSVRGRVSEYRQNDMGTCPRVYWVQPGWSRLSRLLFGDFAVCSVKI